MVASTRISCVNCPPVATNPAPSWLSNTREPTCGAAQKTTGDKPMLILTSTQDHWRSSSEVLDAELAQAKVPHTFRVIPGPHDQPWLREAGTIEALHWLDRLYTP